MLIAVPVGGAGLGAGVSDISVPGSVVGAEDVCVARLVVGVLEGGNDVPCALQATRNNTNNSMNRFIH